MNQLSDLNDALSFVMKRIEREGVRSSTPLTEEEKLLLENLPTAPLLHAGGSYDPEFSSSMFIPRDLAYERLIVLAKQARNHDIEVNSQSDRKWRYAATVFKLNRHPMSWLLRWSGIREEKPWWDCSLLFICAILLVFCFLAMILLGIIETWTRLGWVAGGLGYFVVVLLLYFGSRYVGEWHLKREIQKYRLALQDETPQAL